MGTSAVSGSAEVVTLTEHDRCYLIEVEPGGLIGGRISQARVPYEKDLLEDIYSRGFSGTAVDAGAHIGNHALYLAVVCGLKVHAFEPHPESFSALVGNVRRNHLRTVECYPVALGERAGLGHLVGSNSDRHLVAGPGDVPIHTLDSYGLRGVSVMKVDVEDFEPFVLRGAAQTIERDRPVIYAEARNEEAHQAIAEVLVDYEVTETFGRRWTPVERWEWK